MVSALPKGRKLDQRFKRDIPQSGKEMSSCHKKRAGAGRFILKKRRACREKKYYGRFNGICYHRAYCSNEIFYRDLYQPCA